MILPAAHSQVYDLIVTDKGDSIACRIDGIEDSVMHFEMKYNNNWINTTIPVDEVVSYGYDTIARKMYVFREGTSYIAFPAEIPAQATTMYGIKKMRFI